MHFWVNQQNNKITEIWMVKRLIPLLPQDGRVGPSFDNQSTQTKIIMAKKRTWTQLSTTNQPSVTGNKSIIVLQMLAPANLSATKE